MLERSSHHQSNGSFYPISSMKRLKELKNALLVVAVGGLILISKWVVFAKDFPLPTLPTFENSYDLTNYSGKNSYYDLMKSVIEPKIFAIAKDATKDNEGALKAGKGVAMKLGEHNYN